MNPTNIGAIIRSAAALHMDALVLTSACSDPLYRRAIRVSMGNVFQIPWTYFPKGADWTNQLHQLGFKTVAMALKEDSLDMLRPTPPARGQVGGGAGYRRGRPGGGDHRPL